MNNIFTAIIWNDIKSVKKALEMGVDVNKKNNNGDTALIWAAKYGNTKIVHLLIDSGAKIDEKNNHGNTALMLATINHREEMVKLLLDNGAKNIPNNKGETPFKLAVKSKDEEIIDLFLTANHIPSEELFENKNVDIFKAVKNNDIEGVKTALEMGADVNVKNNDGSTALIWASGRGYTKIVQLLIDNGANVNEKDNDDYTPLINAATYGHKEIVKLLLDNGAKNIPNNKGETPFKMAVKNKDKEIIDLFLTAKQIPSEELFESLSKIDENFLKNIVTTIKSNIARKFSNTDQKILHDNTKRIWNEWNNKQKTFQIAKKRPKLENLLAFISEQYGGKLLMSPTVIRDTHRALNLVNFTKQTLLPENFDTYNYILTLLSNSWIESLRLVKNKKSKSKQIAEEAKKFINLTKNINESGNVFTNTIKIKKEDIDPTIKELSNNIGIPFEELKNNYVGSTGKVKESGDIDIAINETIHDIEDIKNLAIKHYGIENVNHLKGLNILSLSVPVTDKEDRVQVDLMFSNHPDWLKFSFKSAGKQSKYKGKYRSILLSVLAKIDNEEIKNNEGEIVKIKGFVFSPSNGLQYQTKERLLQKNGNLSKNFTVVSRGITITEPHEVIRKIFGKSIPEKDLDSLEQIINEIKKNFPKNKVKTILNNYIKRLREENLEIPLELK